jgi:hypothetical protein
MQTRSARPVVRACAAVPGAASGTRQGKVGTATHDAAVLNDGGKHSVYIETAESERFDAELTSIINSFRFAR